MGEEPETFESWRARTASDLPLGRAMRGMALGFVPAAFWVLSATDHVSWGIILALSAALSLFVSERTRTRRRRREDALANNSTCEELDRDWVGES